MRRFMLRLLCWLYWTDKRTGLAIRSKDARGTRLTTDFLVKGARKFRGTGLSIRRAGRVATVVMRDERGEDVVIAGFWRVARSQRHAGGPWVGMARYDFAAPFDRGRSVGADVTWRRRAANNSLVPLKPDRIASTTRKPSTEALFPPEEPRRCCGLPLLEPGAHRSRNRVGERKPRIDSRCA